MQNLIVHYVDEIRARLRKADISIGVASAHELASMEEAALLKLRDGAWDLVRLIELEIGSRLEKRVEADEDKSVEMPAGVRPGLGHGPSGMPGVCKCGIEWRYHGRGRTDGGTDSVDRAERALGVE